MIFLKTNKLKHGLTKKPYTILKATDVYDAASTVLQNNDVPSHYYSIGEPMDEGVCLEYKDDDGKWIVYEGDRGQKIHVRSFDSAFEAGYDLFESLVIGDDKLSSMRTQFRTRLNFGPFSFFANENYTLWQPINVLLFYIVADLVYGVPKIIQMP